MRSYSQFGEDVHLYNKYLKDIEGGVFCELGAVDGVSLSNTKMLEEFFGWTGFLIEADPVNFSKIAGNRPNSQAFHCAVTSEDTKEIELLINSSMRGVSSVSDQVSSGQFDKWHGDSEKVTVPAGPISDLINASNCPKLDIFCIDVEGSEYEVLKTFDWNIKVKYILIEFLDHFPEYKVKNDLCREFLADKGFKFVERIGKFDSLYVCE